MGETSLSRQKAKRKGRPKMGEVVDDFARVVAVAAVDALGGPIARGLSPRDILRITFAVRAPIYDVIRWAIESYASDPVVAMRRMSEARSQAGREGGIAKANKSHSKIEGFIRRNSDGLDLGDGGKTWNRGRALASFEKIKGVRADGNDAGLWFSIEELGGDKTWRRNYVGDLLLKESKRRADERASGNSRRSGGKKPHSQKSV